MREIIVHAEHQTGTLSLDLCYQSSAQFAAIEGPSGAGKSTFLRIIAGDVRPNSASISYQGTVWQDESHFVPAWQRRCGWVPQDGLLFPHLSVRANLTFASQCSVADLNEVAEALQLSKALDRFPRNLSGGERQRIALGRALLSQAPLLLLDEPFAALDRALREHVRTFVHQWAIKKDANVILVTHHAQDAEDWNAEHWILEHGQIERR